MRKQGESIEDITKYMNDNGYGRKIKKNGKKVPMSFKTLGKIFHNPFYYGLLIQAGQPVDLTQIPGYNFKPAITEEIYQEVQLVSKRHLKAFNTNKRLTFYPF